MSLVVRGAKVHNLKNISVTIPRDRFTVITGPSGSGKSSLAFDTIYAEGQRRYVESLSTYARQFLEQLSKPDLESIDGLSPTISIDQKTSSYNPRSTVGTITEIYDYLRLLFSRLAKPFCWSCGNPIQSQSPQQITDLILTYPEGTKLAILSPIIRGRKGEYQKELYQLRARGFVRARVDGEVFDLSQEVTLDRQKKHDLDVYIDRIVIKGDKNVLSTRTSDSVDLALKMGNGMLVLQVQEPGQNKAEEKLFSEKFACSNCNISYPTPEPRTFSFNSPAGACPECNGTGSKPEEESGAPEMLDAEENFLGVQSCTLCNGSRLKKESLFYKINQKNISTLCDLSVSELSLFFESLTLSEREYKIAERVLKEIKERLGFLSKVGVPYLSLSRGADTLSGGELQRVRLARQIGSSLVGVIYILDEPSIGLHPKDHEKLISTLFRLRDLGNTILVVEHDRETIEKADWVLDLGPGAGTNGGKLSASGTPKEIRNNKKSLTGRYLSGDLEIPTPEKRRKWDKKHVLRIEGACENNLKNLTVDFPLGVFTCVTGVSGSGKSTLVIDILYKLLLKSVYKVKIREPKISAFHGVELIDKVVDINQKPIGRTPRSNPATYIGLFSFIRDLFSQLPESKIRGYGPGRYSFNVKGGRCAACEGDGVKKIEMHFLPDVYIPCDLCRGRRYHKEILDIQYKGKNIADVLEMTATEAEPFFNAVPWLKAKLKTMNSVGLGYLTLGQSSTTLSGGEAQRIKLCKELSRRGTGKTVYILDEPSTGLHFDDIQKLLTILQTLVDQGNTIVVIEHNLDIIKVADHVIDLGPEGGGGGGRVLAAGTPEELAENQESVTGRYLRK